MSKPETYKKTKRKNSTEPIQDVRSRPLISGSDVSPPRIHLPDTSGKRPAEFSKRPVLDNDLDQAVPYLIARAGIRTGQSFSLELRRYKLTLTEWRVCSTLSHRPGQRLSEVALNTSTEQSTLSRVVMSMAKRGLLVRDRSAEDARAIAISLTPSGVELTQRLIPLAQLYQRVLLKGFSALQTEQLKDMLRTLYRNTSLLDES